MDPARYKAARCSRWYHERWEIELAYGEMKTDMLGQAMTLRSQQPDGVKQELWATLLMYNLIRFGDHAHRRRAKVQPCRISFITALRYIVDEWLWSSGSHPLGPSWPNLRHEKEHPAASCCRLAIPSGIRVRFV